MKAPFDYLKNPDTYRRELFKSFKRIFSGTIKESFLIDMVNRIETDPRYGVIYFGTNNPNNIFSLDRFVVGKGSSSINTCKMIVMCHYMNTLSLSEYDRGKQQNDNTYKSKLQDEVIEMLRVEKLATFDFSSTSLESFVPIIYYVSTLNNYLANKHGEVWNNLKLFNHQLDANFNMMILYKIILKIKACVNLADIRATDELMTIYRSLIELVMTYAALWDKNKEIIDSFYYFDKASFYNNTEGKIPDDIESQAKKMSVNPIKFLNYGWIKNLEEFKELHEKSSKAFGMGGLSKILDKKCAYFCPNFGSELYKFYKACNPQTHGTTMIMNYLQLELHIFQNIAVMLEFLCDIVSTHLFDIDFKYLNIDLYDRLSDTLKQSKIVFDQINSDDKLLEKTNYDYRNRSICCLRMK